MLHIENNLIRTIIEGREKSWTFNQLLETYNPFGNLPLDYQNQLYQEVTAHAQEHYSELSERARYEYDFWKNIKLNRISSHTFQYSCQSLSGLTLWEVTINETGLFYKDISGTYRDAGQVIPQRLSDFWFNGPAWPLPDLDIRKHLVAVIRNAFIQVGGKAYDHPFPLFEYPTSANLPHWTQGDYRVSSYVTMLPYGIDFGDQNFHDGLIFRGFLSFENCYTCSYAFTHLVNKQILDEVNTYLLQYMNGASDSSSDVSITIDVDAIKARSKQLYMDNGGQIHYIYLDGFGEEYQASTVDEALWKQELIEKYMQQLMEASNAISLESLIRSLDYHKVPDLERLLISKAQGASMHERQSIGVALWNSHKSDYSVTLLIDFLKDSSLDLYWHEYAWTTLSRMKESTLAQSWILECLQGDNTYFFRKATDVLLVWSIGLSPLSKLLASGNLSQENKTDPTQYQQTLNHLRQILQQQPLSSN